MVELAEADDITDPELLLQILMHDAAEAYVGDLVRAVKHLVPEVALLEGRVWGVVAQRYGIAAALPPLVKHYDNLSLAIEARDIVGQDWATEIGLPDPAGRELSSAYELTPGELEAAFTTRAKMLLEPLGRSAW
jgi:hypothetical protein